MNLPLIIEPQELESHLGDENILIISVDAEHRYLERHIPTAINCSYLDLIKRGKFAQGLLPDVDSISRSFAELGITYDKHIVAYDDEGCGRSSRLLWVLDVIGHQNYSLLNGGLNSWSKEGYPLHAMPTFAKASTFTVKQEPQTIVDKDYVLKHLDDPNVILLDGRSHNEYIGLQPLAKRSGHIPGAKNLDWNYTKDLRRNGRFKSAETLLPVLKSLGVSKDKEIIVYCQTCHRSCHTFVLLKSLGFDNIKAYAGSWSEWGNCDDTPVVQIESPDNDLDEF